MKGLLSLASIAIVLGASFSMALPLKEGSSDIKFELDRTKEVLLELEAAHNWHTEPEISPRDISAVADLVTRLDQQTLDQVDKSDSRLLKALFQAVKHHSDLSEGLSWAERCNDDCAEKVIEEFMEERRTLVSFFEDYKNLSKSFSSQLVDSLLEKPGADVLSEHIISMAFAEYESQMNSLSLIGSGKGNEPISSDLSLIDEVAFYKNREQGRVMGAMLEAYNSMRNLDKFAENFKEQFHNMLHVNGFGVYDHDIIRVDRNLGKFV